MTGPPGRGARLLAAASAATLAVALAGNALAVPLPRPATPEAAPAALPAGSVEAPGSNELVSTPQQGRGAMAASPVSSAEDLFSPPTISANGRYVVFLQETGEGNQVAVRDRRAGTTTVLDGPDSNGPLQHPTISADGAWIAYTRSTDGPNPTEVVLVERETGKEVPIPDPPGRNFFPDQPSLSRDGQFLAMRTRAGNGTEVLVLDRSAGGWDTISVDVNNRPAGMLGAVAAQPAISGDGMFVAFTAASARAQLVQGVKAVDTRQVFLRDRAAARTILVSRNAGGQASNNDALTPAISANGRVVAFASTATDLVPDAGSAPAHVYAWSTATEAVQLVSRSTAGAPGGDTSVYPAVSADGSSVAFVSLATNLVPGDTTSGVVGSGRSSPALVERGQIFIAGDVFVRDLARVRTTRISVARGNQAEANGFSTYPSISSTGRYVAFTSLATNLVETDRNEQAPDVFVRDRPPRIAATPDPVDFGSGTLLSQVDPLPVTIRSTGITPARIGNIEVGGADAEQFFLVDNPCSKTVLAPGATCTVRVTHLRARNGEQQATLSIGSDAGRPIVVRLVGVVGVPKLKLDPELGPPGIVVIATGTGFPANSPIALSWSAGITAAPLLPTVADGEGRFTAQVLVLPRDREGVRNLRATASAPGITLKPVTARFLVERATAEPPTSGLIQVFAVTPGEPIILRR